jgi:starch synthase
MAFGMRTLHIASEVWPLIKTGGLADVVGALPLALRGLGCDARIAVPGFRRAHEAAVKLGITRREAPLVIEAGGVDHQVRIGEVALGGVPCYLLACAELFDRDGIYGPSATTDYDDNARRFSVFAKAALALPRAIGWTPHVVHAHDWQAGIVPALLERGFHRDMPATRSLFTVHNIAYQGAFWHFDIKLTGLDWSLFNPMHLEHYGKLNFLKAGVVFADRVTTVSRRYAEEIQGPEFGYGLDAVMKGHVYKLVGITNGIDAQQWNPEADAHLPARYSRADLAGKGICKQKLRDECGLRQEKRPCLIGVVSRLVEQKGIDLIIDTIDPYILDGRAQLIVLGSGDLGLEQRLGALQARHPGMVYVWYGLNDPLAHRIIAGCDAFLMPSRSEPCGLTQMYSLRYGTLPIVRYTGGLADTVVDVATGEGNGFTFGPIDLGHLSSVIDRACGLYEHFPGVWRDAMVRAMAADHSWETVAKEYIELYRSLVFAEAAT